MLRGRGPIYLGPRMNRTPTPDLASFTATLPDSALVATFSDHQTSQFERRENGTAVVRGLRIFRVGEWTDSRGRRREWTHGDLQRMAQHFSMLRDADLFPNVPVRSDHTISVADVVGYFEAVRVDGDYLVADVEFTEPSAADKWDRKTYRSRSIEIGVFEAPDGATYEPVVRGLAFVDIPAVPGLHRQLNPQGDPPVKFRINGVETEDHAQVAAYIADLEKRPAAPATFRVAGQETTDAAAVQAHIDSLETFRTETTQANRASFVDGLVKDKKIAAAQADEMKAFAQTLSAEQFETFKKGYEKAPTLSMFENHGGTTDPNGGADEESKRQQEIADCQQQISMHRAAGMDDERIAKTASFQRLQVLTKQSA